MPAAKIQTAYIPREATPDRPALVRIKDFGETVTTPDIKNLFVHQATRCCGCATKGCNQGPVSVEIEGVKPGCPLNTHIPDWLRDVASPPVQQALNRILSDSESATLTEDKLNITIGRLLADPEARRELRHAFDLAMEKNPLSEILGRVCPQSEELCEGGTIREGAKPSCIAGVGGHQPVTIGNVENLIGRIGRQAGWLEEMLNTPLLSDGGKEKHISIVGGGPGGMAGAMTLRRLGFNVSVYFREEHLGGLLMYGLPGTKLDKGVVLDFERIFNKTPGITLVPKTNVGATEMKKIRSESARTFLLIGAQRQKPLNIPGDHFKGVVNSLDFLGASIRKNNLHEASPPELDSRGKEVLVLGGGDTAMDCVRESVRQGAKRVTVLYRGSEKTMRAVEKEVKRAYQESVNFEFKQSPLRIVADEFGKAKQIICKNGKNGSTIETPHNAQLVINAFGFTAEPNLMRKLGIPGLEQDDKKEDKDRNTYRIVSEKPGRSLRILSQEGSNTEDKVASPTIFAGGDVTNIGNGHQCLAVYAVRDAMLMAAQVNEQLNRPLKL